MHKPDTEEVNVAMMLSVIFASFELIYIIHQVKRNVNTNLYNRLISYPLIEITSFSIMVNP
jgi:hypothetical protein